MQFNPYQQQQISKKLNDELKKVTMSWNKTLKSWYHYAILALDHASLLELRVQQSNYPELFETNTHGISMNTVAVLANNLESRTPKQMGYSALEWRKIISLNQEVAKDWEGLCAPIRQRVVKEFEIMAGKEVGLKIIKAEA